MVKPSSVDMAGIQRDVGAKGESTFTSWCADVGLTPNKSGMDRTGWDFMVEFPFGENIPDADAVHVPAIECRVQVKATDKADRKLPITLSNLRRLATAPIPAFIIFIEFDGTDTEQRAYIVHVDEHLMSKILKRIHEITQGSGEKRLNKRTLTIHYNESSMMDKLNGNCLRRTLLNHIGNNILDYVSRKKKTLESAGFEEGSATINFEVEGEENLKQLIDISLGIGKQVTVANFVARYTRFGIVSKRPFINEASGKLELPSIKPVSEGFLRFIESKLSGGISFRARLYISPITQFVPEELRVIRIECEFFEIKYNPYTGQAKHSFRLGEGIRLPVRVFRDAIRAINLLTSPGARFFMELDFEGHPRLELRGTGNKQHFDFSKVIPVIECADDIVTRFSPSEEIDISFKEIITFEKYICQFHEIISSPARAFKIDFTVEPSELDANRKVACISMISVQIGSHILGALMVFTGKAARIDGGQYRLIADAAVIERKITSRRNQSINKDDLSEEIDAIAKKYMDYDVVVIDR